MAGFEQSASGLFLPEGAEEAAVRRLLENHDANLRLTKQIDADHACWVYLVSYQVAPGRVERIFSWRDEDGRPLPLSSAILDRVQKHDRNTRGGFPDEDALNARHIERARQESQEWGEELAREFGPRMDGKKSSPLPRSRSLQLARQRVRARTSTRELEP